MWNTWMKSLDDLLMNLVTVWPTSDVQVHIPFVFISVLINYINGQIQLLCPIQINAIIICTAA